MIGKVHGIYQHKKVNHLPGSVQLPGHFIGHKATIAPAPQEVWPLSLNGTH
jgi:hypothetical protein